MPTNSKYLKLGFILLCPIIIGLMWRGFVSIFTGAGTSTKSKPITQQTGSVINSPESPTNINTPQRSALSLGVGSYTGDPATLRIAVPDWFDIASMSGTERTLQSESISIKRIILTGSNYHDQLWKTMSGSNIDLVLVSSDRADDCGKSCGLAFTYSQPIDAFITSSIIDTLYQSYRTMIPYGIDPLVTYHSKDHQVGGSRQTLFNNLLINTNTDNTAGSLPLAIGLGASDKALLRSGKEPYPGYAEIIHQMMIQFSANESLFKQFSQLSETAQLWSYPQMKQKIALIGEKFPLCYQTTAACLVRFGISYYGFGYLTDLERLPRSWQSHIAYDQFPLETNYYPARLRGFIVNRNSKADGNVVGRFLSAYVSDMINTPGLEHYPLNLISPFTSQIETQSQIPQYRNIINYIDSFHVIQGNKDTSLDRARNGGLMNVLEGKSSIQLYISQQSIN